jgi:hypothetical protein
MYSRNKRKTLQGNELSMHKQGYYTHAHTSSWNPTEEWGNLPEVVTGDRKFGGRTYLSIVNETRETVGKKTYGLQVLPQRRKIRQFALRYPTVRPSVYLHLSTMLPLVDFRWSLILETNKNLSKITKLITIEKRGDEWVLSDGKVNHGTQEI